MQLKPLHWLIRPDEHLGIHHLPAIRLSRIPLITAHQFWFTPFLLKSDKVYWERRNEKNATSYPGVNGDQIYRRRSNRTNSPSHACKPHVNIHPVYLVRYMYDGQRVGYMARCSFKCRSISLFNLYLAYCLFSLHVVMWNETSVEGAGIKPNGKVAILFSHANSRKWFNKPEGVFPFPANNSTNQPEG